MRLFRRQAPDHDRRGSDRTPLRLGKNGSARLDGDRSELGPLAQSLLSFWYANRSDAGLPDRRAFDPSLMTTWLGYLSIYEYEPSGEDFRNRLEGSFIADVTGENWTGRYASEVDARFGTRFRHDLINARTQRVPIVDLIQIFQNEFGVAERLLLPVSRTGTAEADQIFVAIFSKDGPTSLIG